ncbi:MAG: GtrA family protein [Chloroflexota bacterium]|nr:GtrA family protein [Chloroflexota bacterium]MDE2946313.1 GtrA family protein [Chloroflexota bacterium]
MSHTVTPKASNSTRRPGGVATPIDSLIVALSVKIGRGQAKEVERFIKFAVVGTLGFIIDLGTVIILQNTVLPPENDQSVTLVNSIAFVLAVCSNFIWNRLWTYPDSRSYSLQRQLTQFAIVSVIGLAIRNVWIHGAYEYLGQLSTAILQDAFVDYAPELIDQNKLGTTIALVFGVLIVMIWNFVANRFWTYSDVD